MCVLVCAFVSSSASSSASASSSTGGGASVAHLEASRRVLAKLRAAVAAETYHGRGASVRMPDELKRGVAAAASEAAAAGGGAAAAAAAEAAKAGAVVDGVFQKLLDKGAFQRAVYPGLTEEQRKGAPQSLQELLEAPAYAKVGAHE